MDLNKPDGVMRISLENVNSLSISNKRRSKNMRPAIIDQNRKRSSTDIICTVENQRHFNLVDEHLQYEELVGPGEQKVAVAGFNEHCQIFNQPGGVGMGAFGAISATARDGKDESGLGRAVWITIEYNDHKFRIVTGYRPCDYRNKAPGKRGDRNTVWHQHRRYYREKGIQDPNVVELYDDYLFGLLQQWRSDGDEVLLLIDANENVYKGRFARRLADKKVNLKSVYTHLHKKKMPFSHITGKQPIMGAFASPGVDSSSYFIGDFKLGVGDHRLSLIHI